MMPNDAFWLIGAALARFFKLELITVYFEQRHAPDKTLGQAAYTLRSEWCQEKFSQE
jgi:hypothetical protein